MVHLTQTMSKEEREAAINQKIEEIRKKNENITRRYEEIENDKRNAENFSQEATERMKTRFSSENVDNSCHILPETTYHDSKGRTRTKKESQKLKKISSAPAVISTSDYRPQRLNENDLPPPDPVFSYLTDRLREGAFCAPISPATNRRRSTSSHTSEMSIGSRNSSRKVSTASNSSWTSDTSSKCSGFSNYQPPRKYSACREYMRNRRLSSEQMISSDEKEDDVWRNNHHGNGYQNVASNRGRNTGSLSDVAANIGAQILTTTEITEGSTTTDTQFRKPWKRSVYQSGFNSEYVTNWRDRHMNVVEIKEPDCTLNSLENAMAQLVVVGEDFNNNNDNVRNENTQLVENQDK